jgi:two-component system NarL family sensor kinase
MNGFVWCVFLSTLTSTSLAQSAKFIDSLESKLPSLKGVLRSEALYELVYYYQRGDVAKAERFAEEAHEFVAGENDEAALAYGFMARGIFFNRTGRIDTAIVLLKKAEDYARESVNDRALLRVLAALAYAHISMGEPAKGLENLFEALRVEQRYPDQELQLKLRTNIPWAYLELKQFRNCISYGKQNLEVLKDPKYEWIALYTYNNIAISYGQLGMLDSAHYFIDKGIQAARRANDNQSLANGYFILGNIYANAGKYDLAIEQYLNARPYREKVGNPFFIVSDLYTVSDLYYLKGEFSKGVKAGEEALALAEKYNLQLKFESTYLALAQNYEGMKDFRNASKFFKLYAAAKDSVYKNASSEAIAEMQTKYETEKKEQQLELQKSELERQTALITSTYVIIASLIISLILIFIIFLLQRSRMRRKQQVLEKEREIYIREAQIQASIQSQETERKRFAQDLHDGMGQLISALRIALNNVNGQMSMDERVAVVNRGEDLLNEMYREIRSIAFNLMPQTLVMNGLVPALKEMADRVNGNGKMIIRVSGFDMPQRLAELYEISVFRIIQEWVNNVMKYAHASVIDIQLVKVDEEINITIDDDGDGFDPSLLHSSSGNGWKNINSRVNLIKGSLDINSRHGFTRTSLMMSFPIVIRKIAQEKEVLANTLQHG